MPPTMTMQRTSTEMLKKKLVGKMSPMKEP